MKPKLSLYFSVLLILATFAQSVQALTLNEILNYQQGQVLGASTTSLVGYWALDDGSGSTAGDSSGLGNNGTLVNTPLWSVGHTNGAVTLNGSSQYINAGPSNAFNLTGDVTIAVWVYHITSSGADVIAEKGNCYDGACPFALRASGNGGLCFDQGDGSSAQDSLCTGASVLPLNQWTHVAITRSGTTRSIYVNGSLITNSSIQSKTPASNAQSLYLGNSYSGSADFFDGKLDEVRIYSRALSVQEITAVMNDPGLTSGTPAPSAPVISSFSASPSSITSGSSSTLSWSVSNATSLLINQSVGTVTGTASKVVSPTVTTTYTLTATNGGGSASAAATVMVSSPVLPTDNYSPTFSTYFGTPDFESIRDVAYDSAGNSYVTGGTASLNFPATTRFVNGGTTQTGASNLDVFVSKFSPAGQLVWTTVLGGPNYDRAYAIEVDSQGYVYVAGRSGSGFPVTAGALQTTFKGGAVSPGHFYGDEDGFVTKLAPDGRQIVWSTYFGADDTSIIRDIAVDSSNNVFIMSGFEAGSFTYTPAVQSKFLNTFLGGAEDSVLAKLDASGSQLHWARSMGGNGLDENEGSVRLDPQGNPYILFSTTSTNIVTNGGFDSTYNGGGDMFVSKVDSATGAVVWGTYIGGSGNESTETHEFAGIDAQGNVYVTGPTQSTDFPTTAGAFQSTPKTAGVNDIFIVKISPNGSQLLASTLVGGSAGDRPEGTSVDPQGNVYLTGVTASTDLPVTANAFQPRLKALRDSFFLKVSSDLSRVLYLTYLGGSADDFGRGSTADSSGNFYFGGEAPSTDFPLVNAYQSTNAGGSSDAFIAKFSLTGSGTVTPPPPSKYPRTIKISSLEGLSAIPQDPVLTVKIIFPASGAVLETQTLIADSQHQYTVTFLSSDPQLVDVRISVAGYLSRKLTGIDTTVNSTTALTVPPLLAGDFNNDNAVNSLDYSTLNQKWNQTSSLGTVDINRDGLVNSLDFAIFKNNFNEVGE